MKQVTLVFDVRSGEVKVEAHGFQGPSCAAATAYLKDALGSCKDFQQKSEWFEGNLELSGSINSNLCG